MAITVTKTNTKLYKSGGWVRVVCDTGTIDAEGNAITVEKTMTMASIEKQAGVLLPKAAIKAILEAELGATAGEVELSTALA